jgi:hypothetical protein
MTALQAFLDSTAGVALIAMVGVAFADFATGTFAALRDGTFQLDAIAAFLRKHIAGRVAPIGTLLALGYFGGGTIGQLFLASAIAAAVAYSAETAGSILGNLNPPKESDRIAAAQATLTPAEIAAGVQVLTSAEPINPVPTE